jgi:hypothetical protein
MSVEGLTVTVLATQLAEAVSKDEGPDGTGLDMGAGMFGSATSEWLRATAKDIALAQRKAAAYQWAYEYLRSRMFSIGRDGWANDCESEIESRIAEEKA